MTHRGKSLGHDLWATKQSLPPSTPHECGSVHVAEGFVCFGLADSQHTKSEAQQTSLFVKALR